MLKKNLIILFLLSLYTTVMVHNAIPHHHHFETAESHTGHDHQDLDTSDDHDHHHSDHEQEEEKSKESEDSKEHPILALHLLIGHSEQIFINQANIDLTVKVKQIAAHIPVAGNILFPIKIPDPDSHGIPPEPDLYSFFYQSSSGLRAPPALA
jgi:hypothetical protein